MDAYEDPRKKDWEELEVTRDELKTLTECLKKDEFRQLLKEYADEVNDPENRKIYEEEITQLERERGVDVTFVHPQPGYVIKTSLDGRIKCFLNIGKSEHVGKPTSKPGSNNDNSPGLSWSIPYVLAPPRDDLDKKNSRCRVFDVVFHPDTLYMAEKNSRFRQIVNETAMDGVENSFKVKLDRKNIKFPKMGFKGTSQPTVIRKPCEKPSEQLDMEPEIYQKIMSTYDACRERRSKNMEEKSTRSPPTTKYFNSGDDKTEDSNSQYTTPKYVVKHQSELDMDEFIESKEAKLHSATPKNLVIVVHLPLLKSANDANLDVQERHLSLKSEKPAKYNLDLPLSYRVDPDKGNAKFDSKLKRLTVTLPVIRDVTVILDTKEDSGVESDHGSPLPESNNSNNQLLSENSSDSQKPIISDLNENNKSDCADTALRTREDFEESLQFMNPNFKYVLPTFTSNVYDDVLAVTIHAKNVDPETINHRILNDDAGIHILLTSMGAGCFPVYYSLCLEIEGNSIARDTLTVEPWDNNVVLSVKINDAKSVSRYFAGINEENMEVRELSAAANIKNKLQSLSENPEIETDKNVEVIRSGSDVIVNVGRSQSLDSDDEEGHESESQSQGESQGEERKRRFVLSRSVSESSGDELPSSIGSGSGSGSARYKSILKSRFSRSISESSIDDSTAPLSSATFNDSINEFNSESEGSSLKKTVRFNDVVSRQVYSNYKRSLRGPPQRRFAVSKVSSGLDPTESNSSILGQRKKNQRKLRNKKRAFERRVSESENSEGEEKYKVEVKNNQKEPSERVRPILHQSNKRSENPKTANIEIERNPRNSANKRKQKRNSENSSPIDNKEIIKTDDNSDGESETECKNDLLFELDM